MTVRIHQKHIPSPERRRAVQAEVPREVEVVLHSVLLRDTLQTDPAEFNNVDAGNDAEGWDASEEYSR